MKKFYQFVICFFVLIILVACENNNNRINNTSNNVNDVIEQQMKNEDEKQNDNDVVVNDKKEIEIKIPDNIDIDLTALSSTMVYSEVFNMMISPDDYIGKIVKMAGSYAYYYDEANDKYYFACVVADATACCSQGIEFILIDDYKYPDDYPKLGDEICVIGKFDKYYEGSYVYFTLRNAILINQ